MEIRAVTVGTTVAYQGDGVRLDPHIPGFLDSARLRFEDAGLPVQTARLASQPFTRVVPSEQDAVVGFARTLETASVAAGFGFTSIGPVDPGRLDYLPLLVEALLGTEQVFGTVIVASAREGPSFPGIAAAADVIEQLARRTEGGFGNLRFAALANCPPGIPFFPAAYHGGGPTSFAVAWEAADLAVDAFTTAETITEAKERLLELVEREGQRVAATATLLAEQHELRFTGLDLSLAPFPEASRSIGAAIEELGAAPFGTPGTLFVASLITDVLRAANLPRTGYSGLMLPVLEDTVLAERAAQGTYTVSDLLAYSAVCGVGLDVVPLPGDVTTGDLRGLLLDVATLALRLDKPLSARLMPIPGKTAGQPTDFSYPYFVNSVAMPLRGPGAGGLFRREGL